MDPKEVGTGIENKEIRYKKLAKQAADLADSLNNPRVLAVEFRDFINVVKKELTREQLGTLLGFASIIIESARSSIVQGDASDE